MPLTDLLPRRQARTMYDIEGACQITACVEDATASVWIAGTPELPVVGVRRAHQEEVGNPSQVEGGR